MRPRVLLVNPNRLRPAVAPLALDYIADYLADGGVEPVLCDLCLAPDPEAALAAVLRADDYDVIAITIRNTDDCFFASAEDFLPAFADLIATIRRHSPTPVVVGGSGYSIAPEAALVAVEADFGITGDGEHPLLLLARTLSRAGDPSDIPGLVWWREGEVRMNAPVYEAIESFPRHRTFLDNVRYFREGGQAGIETKRGCDRSCVYCADPLGKGRRMRLRSPAQVAEEFEALLAQGVDHFHLCDSEFNIPVSHALAVCVELTRRNLGECARWYTYATPAGFSAELALAMKRAGCSGINFGADSGDDRMLAALGRDFRSADLLTAAEACRRAGLIFMFDLLLGGPGETRASITRTIELLKRISPDRIGVSLGVRLYPGTTLSERVRRQGPLHSNPNLHGATDDESFLRPVFYLSHELGEDVAQYVYSLIGDDARFFFPVPVAGRVSYNYSDNERLVEAIANGHRGAYWDILRRLAGE